MDITRSIPCDFCGNKAAGVWGRHLYCWDCFQKREPPDTTVEAFEQGIEDFLTEEEHTAALGLDRSPALFLAGGM